MGGVAGFDPATPSSRTIGQASIVRREIQSLERAIARPRSPVASLREQALSRRMGREQIPRIFPASKRPVLAPLCLESPRSVMKQRVTDACEWEAFCALPSLQKRCGRLLGESRPRRARSGDGEGGDVTGVANFNAGRCPYAMWR